MKTIAYAQKADIAAKAKRVLRSCTRKVHLDAAGKYLGIAEKAITEGYPDLLLNEMREAWREADSRIRNKPRYRFDWGSGQWVPPLRAKDIMSTPAERAMMRGIGPHEYQMAESQRQGYANLQRQYQGDIMRRNPLLPGIGGSVGLASQSSPGYPFY